MLRSMVMLLAAVALGVCGQLAMKLGIKGTGDLQVLLSQSVWRFISAIIGSRLILLGIGSYGVSTFFWLLVLSRVDLSLAYPMLALGYVGILLVSMIFLGEKVTALRWLGTGLIIFGVILTASSAKAP